MKMFTIEWFIEEVNEIKQNYQENLLFEHINSTFQIIIDNETFTFYAYDGMVQSVTNKQVYHPIHFSLKGNKRSWCRLFNGQLSISQGLHPMYQKFKLEGSRELFSANMYYVTRFFKLFNYVNS